MSSSTLYAKVEETIAADIAHGEYRPGDQLPTEDELLQRFEVSRITVRRAIQNLVQRGLLEIRRGRGTFVSEPHIEAELTKLTGFVEDMKAAGRKASARVLSQGVVSASARVAERLQLARGTRVMRIERVRLADGVPVSFDETYLPVDLGKKIVRRDLRMHPIFTLLEEEYGVPLLEADYELEAVAASKAVAEALQVTVGTPIFQIERTSRTTNREPIDYEVLSYRGDLVRFVTKLFRLGENPAAAQTLRSRRR
jgi:GntR family transcriptional regulator